MKKVIIKIATALVIVISLICSCLWFLFESESAYYYTQIDNRKIAQANSGGCTAQLSNKRVQLTLNNFSFHDAAPVHFPKSCYTKRETK
ncbi:MAG: hypothetical protein HFH60_06635 [Lachnospiraceae bacterium]|nr:hypothetical protein [Lachnospiraceae bacterium]